mmetsp:Transcript_27565/g.64702  ORF Transcript_27565/g.64702 Transcript_27565/m.64702 type:complete len:269 (+) Transcript_27565:147-953(+)
MFWCWARRVSPSKIWIASRRRPSPSSTTRASTPARLWCGSRAVAGPPLERKRGSRCSMRTRTTASTARAIRKRRSTRRRSSPGSRPSSRKRAGERRPRRRKQPERNDPAKAPEPISEIRRALVIGSRTNLQLKLSLTSQPFGRASFSRTREPDPFRAPPYRGTVPVSSGDRGCLSETVRENTSGCRAVSSVTRRSFAVPPEAADRFRPRPRSPLRTAATAAEAAAVAGAARAARRSPSRPNRGNSAGRGRPGRRRRRGTRGRAWLCCG